MDYSGKTLICNVLFLDIVGYSKTSVVEQISVKERFNGYLAAAIDRVPIEDRIILDTGDGAAINFLGDVEDALNVALSMQKSMRQEEGKRPALAIRMGINLGPVRLIRDINGRPNIIGDGINSSQRVMGFADPGQILVSRPYYDAMSNLSSKYVHLFRFEGSRTDKHHVREYEVYAIERSGRPGFGATMVIARNPLTVAAMPLLFLAAWLVAPTILPRLRPSLPATPAPVAPAPARPTVASAPSPAAPAMAAAARPAAGAHDAAAPVPGRAGATSAQTAAPLNPQHPGKAKLRIFCAKGTQVVVDRRPRGGIRRSELVLWLNKGSHIVTLIHPPRSPSFTTKIELEAGQIATISPGEFCAPLK